MRTRTLVGAALLCSFFGAAPALAMTDAEIQAGAHPSPESYEDDIAQLVSDGRFGSAFGNDCNPRDLATRERLIQDAKLSLMAMRDSTTGTVMDMADNLRDTFRGMESLFPGGPGAYDYLMKPTQAVLGSLGPYGEMAKGFTEVLDNYKDWHNSEEAAKVSESVKAQAQNQLDALADAEARLQQIERAINEMDSLIQGVLKLMQTYPERCRKGSPVTPDLALIQHLDSPIDVARQVSDRTTTGFDDCDLDELIRLAAMLEAAIANLEGQQRQNVDSLLDAFAELNASLEKFEGALPTYEMKDFVKLLQTGESLGRSVASFNPEEVAANGGADLTGLNPSDLLPLEEIEAATKRAEAEDALKADANAKLKKIKDLIAERDRITEALEYVHQKSRYINYLINTWEDRCVKEPADDTTQTALGNDYTGTHVLVGTESPKWCTYGDGNPTTFSPTSGGTTPGTTTPGTTTPGGTTPRGPGGGTPTGPGTTASGPGGAPSGFGGTPTRPHGPCEQELVTINRFLEQHGTELRQSANPNDHHDLQAAEARRRELLSECGSRIRETGSTPPSNGNLIPGSTVTTRPRTPEQPPEDESQPPGEPTVTIYVKAKSTLNVTLAQGNAGTQIKLFASSTTDNALPGQGPRDTVTDADQDPIQGMTDGNGDIVFRVPGATIGLTSTPTASTPAFEIQIDASEQSSVNAQLSGANPQPTINALPGGLRSLLTDVTVVNGTSFLTFTFPAAMLDTVRLVLIRVPGVVKIEINFCRDKQAVPDDPLYAGNRAWKQKYDNQWAIKRVGFTDGPDSAWKLLGDDPQPVVVAVIDTGLDWNHLDIDPDNIWRNPGEVPDNGVDDDGNGYVDDLIGWDFFAHSNYPWDHDGHGTFVTGEIAAGWNNGVGIAGINPYVRIMVLKALNSFGHTRASYLAKAIVYAVDNGARVINMSVGGHEITTIEKEAITYAVNQGVMVVVASGNEGIDVSDFGIAGLDGVVTVAATGLDDERPVFSNWGAGVDIAAPGMEVLSLRARRTDTMRDIPDVKYVNGANYVGEDNRYYRASGTSFSAPIVTGVASLLLSKNPDLTLVELKRILLNSAEDIEIPGVDQYSGFGLVDARAALSAAPEFFIDAGITGVQVVQERGATYVRVLGTADADKFAEAWVEIGRGDSPQTWKKVTKSLRKPVRDGALGDIEASELQGAPVWTLRVITRHKNGRTRESHFTLTLG